MSSLHVNTELSSCFSCHFAELREDLLSVLDWQAAVSICHPSYRFTLHCYFTAISSGSSVKWAVEARVS